MSAYSVSSRPGSSLVMIAWAPSIAPSQSLAHAGLAHSVSTALKPASLPPTLMVTTPVDDDSADSWLAVTSAVVAPEQATNVSAAPVRAASSTG